jgi:hypothetical protein
LAWLVQLGQQRSLPAWYSTVMAMLFVTTLLSGNFDPHSPLMIAPLVAAGTFLLTLVAALGEMCATHTHLSDGMEFSRTSARSHNQ